MKKLNIFTILAITLFTLFGVATFGFSANAGAITMAEGAEAARCDGCPANLFGNEGIFSQVTSTILYIVGIIAVIMLIIGGIRYIVSGGDAKKVTEAKNTILYAIIGLIICFFAYAIVNFVIDSLPSDQKPSNGQTTSLIAPRSAHS